MTKLLKIELYKVLYFIFFKYILILHTVKYNIIFHKNA